MLIIITVIISVSPFSSSTLSFETFSSGYAFFRQHAAKRVTRVAAALSGRYAHHSLLLYCYHRRLVSVIGSTASPVPLLSSQLPPPISNYTLSREECPYAFSGFFRFFNRIFFSTTPLPTPLSACFCKNFDKVSIVMLG